MAAPTPEMPSFDPKILDRYDNAVQMLSGGFERLPEFSAILTYRMAALPALLKEINNAGVARLTVIDAIANLVGVPIPFPAEDCTLEEARAHVQLWGIKLGYIQTDSAETGL